MRHRCYHGAAHQSTASHSWFTQLHNEVNYLTSKLRQLKSKPCGNYKYAEGRNCKTEKQNWTVAYLLALTVWTACHISASNENLLKFQVNSLVHSWVSHTFFTFPHRGKTSSDKENAWINAIFHEPQSTSDRFEGNLYDVKVNVLRWRPLSFKHILIRTQTHSAQCMLTVRDVSLCPSHKSMHIRRSHFMVFFLLKCRSGWMRRVNIVEGCRGERVRSIGKVCTK